MKNGYLVIYKSWEKSEEDTMQKFYEVFNTDNPGAFVPVGFNLSFDYFSLLYRWREAGIKVKPKRPNISYLNG